MSTLKKLLMTATVLTALAAPAHAAENVNGWLVDYYPSVWAGACSASMHYTKNNSSTRLSFIRHYNQDGTSSWGIMLSNKDWKAATASQGNYQVRIETVGKGQPQRSLVKMFKGMKSGGIHTYDGDLSIDEMNYLAFDAEASVRFVNNLDGKVIAHLQINNSAAPIRAVTNCLKARAPNDNVAKTDPAKPPTTPPKKEEEGGGTGTGFFVAPKHVLTSAHVVKSCNAIYVKYPTYKAVQAYVVGFDAKNDLAVLKTTLPHDGIASFRLRGKLGEFVASYGFPFGSVLSTSGNFTTGGLTALRGVDDDSSTIQVSTPIQPGNSGGPLMDSSGSVLGVTKAIMGTLNAAVAAGGAVPQNVNFGVSAGTVVTFLGASNIDAQVTSAGTKLEPEAIAEIAMKFTVQISCESPALNKGS
jgi:S1-C subfamily serine protease